MLCDGRLVAFPTETVYGLGAHALDAGAVARVFEAKQRPAFDPLIVHLDDATRLTAVTTDLPPTALALAERFWPGPLTLVLPKGDVVPPIVTSGLDTVAVRVPDHPVAHDLLARVGLPVAAPSANPFGRLSPTTAAHVVAGLGERVDLVVDGGPTTVGVESTIVDPCGERPVVLRHGAIPVEALVEVVGPVAERTSAARPAGPGQLPEHYAPSTPLRLAGGGVDAARLPAASGPDIAYLAFREAPPPGRYRAVEVLSPSGDLVEAAAALFAALHRLDASGAVLVVAEPVPDTGLGRAINDRLQRAAAGSSAGVDGR